MAPNWAAPHEGNARYDWLADRYQSAQSGPVPSAEGPPHAAFDAWRASDPVHQIVTRIPDFRISGEVQRLRSIWFDAITKLPVQFTPERCAVTQ